MADGALRPWVVAGVAIAIIVTAAQQGQGEGATSVALDDSSSEAAAGEPSAESAASEPPVAPATGVGPEPQAGSPPPVPARDGLGTRLLNGHDGRTISLTFDDGPHRTYTPQVLDILRDHEVHATFCIVGQHSEGNVELIRRIVAEGHALCNHTYSHDYGLPDRDAAQIKAEMTDTNGLILAAAPDADIGYFRAPFGLFTDKVNGIAQDLGFTPLGWSIDPRDWSRPGGTAIHDHVVDNVHPGAVILLHDGGGDRSGTVAALPGVIAELHAAGYEFVVPAR